MNSNQLGILGETAVIKKCIENDIPVYRTVNDMYGVDLVVEFNNRLNKIQVKSSTCTNPKNKNSRTFCLTSQTFVRQKNNLSSKRHKYDINNVDYFALYDGIDDIVYIVKNNGCKASFTINKLPLNNQKKYVNNPSDYEFDNFINKSKLEKRDGCFVIHSRKKN